MDSNSTYDPYVELELYFEQIKDEIAETFEKLAPTSLQKLNQNSPSRYIDKNHFQQNVPDRTSSNLLKYEKHSTIPLQSFKSVYNASNHHNKKHGTCMKYFESIFPNTLEKKKFDFVKKRTKFLSVCNLHHSLNSLQSVHSYSVNDFTNIESGIEVSNSSIDFGGNDANFHSHSLKNYQHDITNTTYPLFGNDSYSNIDILSQLSDNDENDRFQNQSCFYMRCNSFPTSSHENQKRINMNKKDKQKFDEVLTTRSNSAPIVTKIPNDVFFFSNMVRCSRSQSGKNIAEIEALEACNWLKAAGFPQYASMFQENLFPIDLSTVAKDHPFLENDPLQSLYRRLVILNKCAKIRVELQKKTAVSLMDEESDDENCALSENWSFEPQIRRWSRIVEMGPIELNIQRDSDSKESSSDSRESSTERSDLSAIELLGFSTLPLGLAAHPSGTQQGFPNKFKRTGSEKLKHGAKALLKKVESIKAQRRKRHSSRKAIFMNEPGFLDITSIDECFQKKRPSNLKYSKSNPASPMPSSPIHGTSLQLQNSNFLSPIVFPKTKKEQSSCIIVRKSKDKKSGDETSHCSDSSQDSSGKSKSTISVKKPSRIKRFLQRSQPDECETLSDSECQITKENIKHEKTLSSIKSASNLNVPKPIRRGGSLNLGKESKDFNEGFQRKGFRSRSTLKSVKSKVNEPSNTLSIKKESLNRWHSFQKTERKTSFALSLPLEPSRRKSSISGVQLSAMSCGQLQVVRKLALVTLTGYMERYCPSHKSGWQHWELPKFIKKIKAPDYKDKKVFGVPILLTVQRTGHSLPLSIQGALKWLRLNAIECVGLFRKSGVKSRIAKLKWIVETSDDDSLSLFEGQLAYDVADMVKQYFRDLPESILTKKLTDTFLSIFKHLPSDVQADALQSTLLLLPDENRDVLYYLLDFLKHISDGSMYNQMTSHNLAVCLAPSIFQNTIYSQRSTSVSPRNKKIGGTPDAKDFMDAHASHECLAYMIQNYKSLFTISHDRFSKCSFNYMDESKPVTIDNLWNGNWNAYVYESTKATIKEGRERSRGWVSINSLESSIEISYKKVGDGHPLRLWRVCTEIDAEINEVQHHIVKQRQLWDPNLLRSRIVENLNERSHIYQYVVGGLYISDYCVLRSVQTDLPKGACVIIETSVEHPDAYPLLSGVRGVILASRYLLEPCSIPKKTKIMHLARVDTKGHTPEWYNSVYGHLISQYMSKIKSNCNHNSNTFPNMGSELTI